MKKEKVVLAFSGGLDTSFCAKYLSEEKGYEVYTAVANTGGFSDEESLKSNRRKKALYKLQVGCKAMLILVCKLSEY